LFSNQVTPGNCPAPVAHGKSVGTIGGALAVTQRSLAARARQLIVALTVVALFLPTAVTVAAKPSSLVNVQLLAINDFHGNLAPPAGSSGRVGTVDAGGVEYLATHIKALEATNPNTAVVAAGDLIGASPLTSALFHDEPSIEALNVAGLDFAAVGNHEFDEGVTELLRMQNGGCHPVDGCQDGDAFLGADFQYLAANVKYKNNDKPIFPAYKIASFGGAKLGFIGLTLEGTPDIVTAAGIATVNFFDEAQTINAAVTELKKKGVETIVVLIHEGGAQTVAQDPTTINTCTGISGPIVDIVNNTSDDVDLFISGHTHNSYNCVIDGRPVTSASSFGRLVTDVDMTIDKATGAPTTISVNNVIVTRTVAKDPAETTILNKYTALAAPLANRVIGSITANITRTQNSAGESALGDVIADGQLADTAPAGRGDAVAAFMNPGGIRTDLVYSQISGGEQPGEITYGEMFNVQPFGNNLVTMTLTGAQIHTMLEQQFCDPTLTTPRSQNTVLQPSIGFTYSWSTGAACGSKVSGEAINGVPLVAGDSYRITVNSFLADGGDGFPILKAGTSRQGGAVDTDAFAAYFAANSPVPPGPQNRITLLP
jgi:5'-nucleotidase